MINVKNDIQIELLNLTKVLGRTTFLQYDRDRIENDAFNSSLFLRECLHRVVT